MTGDRPSSAGIKLETQTCIHCGKPIKMTSFSGIRVYEHAPHRPGSHFPDTSCDREDACDG